MLGMFQSLKGLVYLHNQLVIDQPDFALLLSWHLSDSIVAKIRDDGFKGKIILPLPEPKII